MKFKTIEEVKQERERVAEQFNGELPSYLVDYFDEIELKKLSADFYKEVKSAKYNYTHEERVEYCKKKEEEFWEENEGELVKSPRKGLGSVDPVFEEASRNTEHAENERELTEEEIQALIKLCENDIYLFAIRYFPHYLKTRSSRLHKYLYNLVDRHINDKKRKKGFKYAIAAPRSNSKSTIISGILPLWCICYNKKKFIIMVSETINQAEDFLSDIKAELIMNELLIRDFPHACGKGDLWRSDEIITNNEVKVKAIGTGSRIRGRKFGIYRPDLICFDDLESSDMIRSPSQRDFIRFEWFNKDVLYAGGEEGYITDFLVVGTVLGKDSLLNALLDSNEYPDWNSKRFRAVESFSVSPLWDEWAKLFKNRFDANRKETARKFYEEHEKEMLEGTEVLWPEGDSYYELMIYKLSNPSGFLTEKMNSPVDTTKVLVQKEDLHWENFKSNKEIIDILDNSKTLFFGSLDPSLGKKASSGDYSCIVTIARDTKSGYLFVVDINIKRRSVDDQIDAILNNHIKYNYKLFGVETNAAQYVIKENLRKKSIAEGIYIPLKEIENYQDKKMRVEGIIPLLMDGTIVFDKNKYDNNQQYNLGIEQLCTFTGENDRHDDFCDALEMTVRIAKANRFKMITLQNKRHPK